MHRLAFLFCLSVVFAWPQREVVRGHGSEWTDPNKSEPAGTKYRTFHSRSIGGEVSYLLYLPPGYEEDPQRRYPVIYWLHGLGGNQRTGAFFASLLDGAIRAGDTPPAIAVLVNGMRDSMYCDSRDGSTPVAKVIVDDLVPHIDRTYRTIADRRARAIEGYSMGGFGAARLGFGHPELFGAVSVMAGALHTEETLAERRKEIFAKVFGGDAAYYRSNSPWTIVEKQAGRIRGRTFVRIGVGDQDRLAEWNRELHALLNRLEIETEFVLVPGVGHSGQQFYRVLGAQVWGFYRRAFGGPLHHAPQASFVHRARPVIDLLPR